MFLKYNVACFIFIELSKGHQNFVLLCCYGMFHNDGHLGVVDHTRMHDKFWCYSCVCASGNFSRPCNRVHLTNIL